MRTVLIALMVAVAGSALADYTNDYRAGLAFKTDYAKANPLFEKVIADAPGTIYAGHAALNLTRALTPEEARVAIAAVKKDYAELPPIVARADFMLAVLDVYADRAIGILSLNKVLADHPDDLAACRSALRYLISSCKLEKNLACEETALKLWLSEKYAGDATAALLTPRLVDVQIAQGKLAEANATAFAYLTGHGKDATPDQLVGMFEKVSASAMSFDAYRTALQSVLLAVPASETNAVFLGLVKSELEKVK